MSNIIHIDSMKPLKNKSIKDNILSIVKTYAKPYNKNKFPPISDDIKAYTLLASYDNKLILFIVSFMKSILHEEETISITTMEPKYMKLENPTYNTDSSLNEYPGVMITFNDKRFDERDAYINFIAHNEKQNISSGTFAINLSLRLCYILGVKNAHLTDESFVKCVKKNDMSLKLLKVIITGNTWYGSHGFINKKLMNKRLKKAIKAVQNIKIKSIIKTMNKILNAMKVTLKKRDNRLFQIWIPNNIDNAVHDSKWLRMKAKQYTEAIKLLKKHSKHNDTIKSFTERIVIKDCEIYLKCIQRIIFLYTGYGYDLLLVIFHNKKIISYPHVKELYLVNKFIYSYMTRYTKKIS